MSSLPASSTPGKPEIKGTAGERELLIHSLRTAVARSRLATNVLETIGVSLRHKQIDCDEAMEWLDEEGLLNYVQLGRVSA